MTTPSPFASPSYSYPQNKMALSPRSGTGLDLTRSIGPRPDSTPYRSTLNGAINVQSNLASKKELDYYDNFMSSQDDFTPDIKNIIGMYLDTPLDLADILVYGHESLTRPDNINKLCTDRARIVKLHEDLKNEALAHRQKVAKLINDNKSLFPERSDQNGQHLKNAIFDLNSTPRGPDKVSQQMRELKDDLTVLLDKDITTLPQNKYNERLLGKQKRSQLYPQSAPIVINQASNPTLKLRLSPDDRYISHELIKQNPSDDVKVIIEKQPPIPVRSVSPPPVYRPEVVMRTMVQSPSPPPKIRSPTKSIVSLNQSSLEYQTPIYQSPVIVERNVAPVRSEP